MFALGIVSLVQICFLPGFLIVRAFRLRLPSWMGVLVMSFALSLTANSLVIFPLTALGLYVRPLVVAVMVAEIALLVVLIVRRRRERPRVEGAVDEDPVEEDQAPASEASASCPISDSGGRASILRNPIALFLLLASAYWIVALLVRNVGTVFDVWDAALRWNPWAESWAGGVPPDLTWEYPQLVPTNWSISYVLTGANVQFFPKAMMPLFALFVLVLFLDLALRTRRIEYVFGLAIMAVLSKLLLPRYVASGDMEFAVAFFAFAAVWCLLVVRGRAETPGERRLIVLGAVLSGAGAVTKQGGLYMLAAYPLLVHVLCLRGSGVSRGGRWRLIAVCIGIIVVMAAPWYVYSLLRMVFGDNRSIVGFLLTGESLHEGRTLFERLVFGIGLIGGRVGGAAGLIAIAAALLLGLRDRTSRWITCIVVVPYTLIWAFGFSYGLRNYSFAFPFLGLACGAGVAQLWPLMPRVCALPAVRLGWRPSPRALIVLGAIAALIAAAGLIVGSVIVTPEWMQARQRELMRQTWNPGLNAMLYRAAAQQPFEGTIITHYDILEVLPGLAAHMDRRGIGGVAEDDYPALLDGTLHKEIKYVLFSKKRYPRLFEAMEAAREAGHCEVVDTYASWYLVRIVGEPAASPPTPPDEATVPEPS